MNIAVTGGTGFIGHYILQQLARQGHRLRAWKRESSLMDGLQDLDIEWLVGDLQSRDSMAELVEDCEAVVHAALWKPGRQFQGGEGPLREFVEMNLLGTLDLITTARQAGVERFVFLSTCAVHDVILDDRPLDETHPCWPRSHYGAHKAAIECFVHSFAHGQDFNICALRPTGVYGLAHPECESKWYDLVSRVARGETVQATGGGKEVHASDVAKAVSVLLRANQVAGQAFNCYDRYISEHEVASIAREISGSQAKIEGRHTSPRHQIATGKLQALGMTFGGSELLRQTIAEMLKSAAES